MFVGCGGYGAGGARPLEADTATSALQGPRCTQTRVPLRRFSILRIDGVGMFALIKRER